MPHVAHVLTIWQNMMVRGLKKILISKLCSKLGKIWKCSLDYSKIPTFHFFHELGKTWKYTQPKTNISKSKLWIYGWTGKIYVLILASLLKIRWEIHLRKGWSHFKLNINDWDIPFPKVLRLYQWIRKNIFHWEKWNEPISNSAHIRIIWPKDPEDIYF